MLWRAPEPFTLQHAPEPYLKFHSGNRPLYFLTTNPGCGHGYQTLEAASQPGSPFNASEYAQVACSVAELYRERLQGEAAGGRIKKVISLAKELNMDGVFQAESFPFHSSSLPNKKRFTNSVVFREYHEALASFLSGKTCLFLTAVRTDRPVALDPSHPWIAFALRMLKCEESEFEEHAVHSPGGESVAKLLVARRADDRTIILLVQGSNNFPSPQGMAEIAQILG